MYPHRAEDWALLRRLGRWRFIVADGARSAIATAFGMVVLGLAAAALMFYQSGQTLDFHWFQIAGRPGADTFHVYRHALALLPVGFLFSLVFWLFAGAKCWWLNERVHREALAKQGAASVPGAAAVWRLPVAARLGMLVGECLFLAFFISLPVANNWPALRPPPPWDEVLYAAGLAGASLVWGIGFAARLINLATGILAFCRRLLQPDTGQAPGARMFPHPTLGPVHPPKKECAGSPPKR